MENSKIAKLFFLLGILYASLEKIINFSGVDPLTVRQMFCKGRRGIEDIQELCKETGIDLNINFTTIVADIEKAMELGINRKEILQPYICDIDAAINKIK